MTKYLYALVILFITALSAGVYTNRTSDYDKVLTEIEKELQGKLAIKIIKEVRRDTASSISILTWDDFQKLAVNIAREYDIPPSVMIAQAALETARGTSKRAREDNNYFGLCAYSDDSPGCRFSSVEEGVRFYARLIKYDYQWAYEARHNPYEMIRRIKALGYATDPHYVDKVTSMAEFIKYL